MGSERRATRAHHSPRRRQVDDGRRCENIPMPPVEAELEDDFAAMLRSPRRACTRIAGADR